jgi:holin-like protein
MKLIIRLIIEIGIILGIYFLGMWVSDLIRPVILIPGNILGMGILFAMLSFNIVKIENIEKTSGLLLKHMGFFFVPLCVTLYITFDYISDIWVQIVVILVISNMFVMTVTGKTVQKFIEIESRS